jgi:hypothetical protein
MIIRCGMTIQLKPFPQSSFLTRETFLGDLMEDSATDYENNNLKIGLKKMNEIKLNQAHA